MTSEPTRLFLFRHGAVADPFPQRIYGDLDVPLSQAGELESSTAAASLDDHELDAIVHSGLARARHLAERLSSVRPNVAVLEDPRLREIHRGPWAGVDLDELRPRHASALEAWRASGGLLAPPGGETLQGMFERVLPAVAEHAARHAGGRVAIAAHLWVLRCVACACEDGPRLHHAPGLTIPTAAALVVDWPETGPPRRVPGELVFDAERAPKSVSDERGRA